VISREMQDNRNGSLTDTGEELSIEALASTGESSGTVSRPNWLTTARSRKLSSALESMRADRGKAWLCHTRLASSRGLGDGQVISLNSIFPTTAEPPLAGRREHVETR
jgi:hypothetical protein